VATGPACVGGGDQGRQRDLVLCTIWQRSTPEHQDAVCTGRSPYGTCCAGGLNGNEGPSPPSPDWLIGVVPATHGRGRHRFNFRSVAGGTSPPPNAPSAPLVPCPRRSGGCVVVPSCLSAPETVSCLSNEPVWTRTTSGRTCSDRWSWWMFLSLFIAVDHRQSIDPHDHCTHHDHDGVAANSTDWHGDPPR
jgi:hypothetical protein